MAVTTRATAATVRVGDVVVLLDGDRPFEVLAVGAPVGDVRQLDVVPQGSGGPPVRLTLSVQHSIRVL